MTKTFDFSFAVSGIDPHEEGFADAIFEAGCDDASLMLYKGAIVVNFMREHDTFIDAVASAYANLLESGVTIERFDPDFLVSSTDIANKINVSRQAVANYANGKRGEGFPPPIVRVTSSSPLWDWVDVSYWLYKNKQIEESVFDDALVSRGVNMYIQKADAKTKVEGVFYEQIEHALAA